MGDGLNLYAHCGNNPVIYDDPSGYAKRCQIEQTGGKETNDTIPWTSKEVSSAAQELESGTRMVTVSIRSQAEELFLGLCQGEGYINVTGMDAVDSKIG